MTVQPDHFKRGILMLNLGGPETQDDVRPFLYHLFKDPEIIRIPFDPLRKSVAWLVSGLRAKQSRHLYARIGGGSPIRRFTDAQSAAVEKKLGETGRFALVKTAFTCSPPFVEKVVQEMEKSGVEKIFSFPLYPQYSYTTTRSALGRVRAAVKKYAPAAKYFEVRCWHTHPSFIKAHAERIREQVAQFSDSRPEKIHLLFSAHSIPEKLVVKEGDPYKDQIEETVESVVAELGWKGPYRLSWQSKLGPVKWLAPATIDVVRELGDKGAERIVVDPIAFVSDHIETLCEIDLEIAEVARRAGVKEFRKAEGLNTHPLFIQALTEIISAQKDFWENSRENPSRSKLPSR